MNLYRCCPELRACVTRGPGKHRLCTSVWHPTLLCWILFCISGRLGLSEEISTLKFDLTDFFVSGADLHTGCLCRKSVPAFEIFWKKYLFIRHCPDLGHSSLAPYTNKFTKCVIAICHTHSEVSECLLYTPSHG